MVFSLKVKFGSISTAVAGFSGKLSSQPDSGRLFGSAQDITAFCLTWIANVNSQFWGRQTVLVVCGALSKPDLVRGIILISDLFSRFWRQMCFQLLDLIT